MLVRIPVWNRMPIVPSFYVVLVLERETRGLNICLGHLRNMNVTTGVVLDIRQLMYILTPTKNQKRKELDFPPILTELK